MNIVLIGMRGAGKSHLGRLLAARLGREFVDLDVLITARAGQTVSEIVAASGWPGFRDLEAAVTSEVAARDNLVIATGGGIVCAEENTRALKRNGTLVWLRADAATLLKRAGGDANRPPLSGESPAAEMRAVLAERTPLYTAAADLEIDTMTDKPARITAQLAARFAEGAGCD